MEVRLIKVHLEYSNIHICRYGYNTPPDYEDNQGFCGGQTVQWSRNGGKCGLCGDAYHGHREHEAPGGKFRISK